MKRAIIKILIATVIPFAVSCVKFERPGPPEPKAEESALTKVTVPADFNWSTGKSIEVIITGLPTVISVRSTLEIMLTNRTVIFSALHDMSNNMILSLVVPSETSSLILKYGSVEETLTLANNKAEYSFIPQLDDE